MMSDSLRSMCRNEAPFQSPALLDRLVSSVTWLQLDIEGMYMSPVLRLKDDG